MCERLCLSMSWGCPFEDPLGIPACVNMTPSEVRVEATRIHTGRGERTLARAGVGGGALPSELLVRPSAQHSSLN